MKYIIGTNLTLVITHRSETFFLNFYQLLVLVYIKKKNDVY